MGHLRDPESAGSGSLPQAIAGAHRAFCFALVLALADRLALLELALALRHGNLDLRATVEEIQPQGHERVSARRDRVRELDDLVFVQEQLSGALGRVVGPVTLRVLGDVHGVEVGLSAVDVGVTVREIRPPLPERLHFGAGQHEPGFVRLLDRVVVSRLLVRRDELLTLLTRHGATSS